MQHVSKRAFRPAFDGLEGRQLLSMLPETSSFAPARATFDGKIHVAGTGTDSAHRLNVESSSDKVHVGKKVTLTGTRDAAPALAARQGQHQVSAAATTISTTQLQWDLAGLGYLSWSGIDGIYGPVTTAAVRSFQSDAGITVDGIAGPQTDGVLSTVIKEVQAKVGATQDGLFGPQTKADVEKYQRATDCRWTVRRARTRGESWASPSSTTTGAGGGRDPGRVHELRLGPMGASRSQRA